MKKGMENSNRKLFHECFIYAEGNLIWKERPVHHFGSKKAQSITNTNFAGSIAGTANTSKKSATTYIAIEIKGKAYKAHRIIWEMFNGPVPENMIIDHIDGDGSNNRLNNLRLVDKISSMHNLPKQKSNTSGVVGVCWHKAANKWQSRISINGIRIDLGRYKSFDEAVSVRLNAEKEYGYHQNHGRDQ